MRLPNPYTAGASLLVVLLVFGVVLKAGHKMGVKAEAKRVAPVIEQLLASNESLTLRIREVDAAVKAANAMVAMEAAKAREQQAAGAQAVTEAKEAARVTQRKVSSLERDLERERSTCTQAEARICGIQLR